MSEPALKRILFVDDDQAVLAGLENVLHRDRKRWAMVFALGSESALAQLALQPFDMVVTDMRMPGMDGMALLREIRDRYPETVRVMLSGSDCESAMPFIDGLLTKPCDAKTLRATLDRLFTAR